MNTFMLDLGDWSGDGHGKTDIHHLVTDATLEQVQLAYLRGCEQYGIAMHDGDHFHGRDKRYQVDRSKITLQLPTGYEEHMDDADREEVGARTGMTDWEDDPDGYRDLWLFLVRSQLPNATFEWSKEPISVLHGGNLNINIGYNLFE